MSTQCVVLNASHEPLSVVTAERGLVLVLEGKAVILEEVPGKRFRSRTREFPIPTLIILTEYRKTGGRYYGAAQLNQRNLFLRDKYVCQYCLRYEGQLEPNEYLTRDHLHPQTLGGRDTWKNLITSCSTCNHRKDDKLLPDFVRALDNDIATAEDQLARTTSHKIKAEVEQRLSYLRTVAGSAQRWTTRIPREPTVFEILTALAARKKLAA